MARLIDKDALVSILEAKADMACGEPKLHFTRIAGMVNLLPEVDAVEVVRCKDCKYYATATANQKGFLICPASGMEIADNDYCSYGERRTNGRND